jgi:hypothetical protein
MCVLPRQAKVGSTDRSTARFTDPVANRVASLSDKLGQRQVNTMAQPGRISPEPIWLIDAALGAHARARKPVAATFNPKVAGSIPARPITSIPGADDDAARSVTGSKGPRRIASRPMQTRPLATSTGGRRCPRAGSDRRRGARAARAAPRPAAIWPADRHNHWSQRGARRSREPHRGRA